MRIRILLLVFVLLGGAIGSFGTSEAQTQGSPATALPVFDFPQAGVEFLTGDTWRIGGETYRLYGVQSCIRGADFTNAAGAKKDCGEASLAYTVGIVRDTHPRCTAVAPSCTLPTIVSVPGEVRPFGMLAGSTPPLLAATSA